MIKILFNALIVLPFFCIGQKYTTIGLGKKNAVPPFELVGNVYNAATGEAIIGANVVIERQQMGTSTNEDGTFSFSLYQGSYQIKVSTIGFKPFVKNISLLGPGRVGFPMAEDIIELDEVVLRFEKENKNIVTKSLGTETLNISSIKTLPLIGGEVNVLNSLTLLPGVSSQGEAAGGFNVRGGGADQNLILLGGATLYNPYHLFGFFSGFNASIVSNMTLHKGMIPPKFGGRASSVIDISYKKGNFRHWNGDVTLGTSASKFSLRGPLIQSKLAIMAAGRIAYPNWLLRQANDPDIANSTAKFHDANFIANYAIDDKNSLEFSFYTSSDAFVFPDNLENQWSNQAQVVKWNTEITSRILLDIIFNRSAYNSNLIDNTPQENFTMERIIEHNEAGIDFSYEINDKNQLQIGGQFKLLTNDLGKLYPGQGSSLNAQETDIENANEYGIYLMHEIDLNDRLGISYGMRHSGFTYNGPRIVNEYDPELTKTENSIISSSNFGDETIKTYSGLEPRAAINYQLNSSTSVKAGYSKMYQYIHLITNTTSISPIDTWKLSDSFLEPQIVSQYAIGLFKNFKNNRIESFIQAFYKELENVPEYKDGADLFLNDHMETELTFSKGEAYGIEAYISKSIGRINGWMSYTYSRSFRTINNNFPEEIVNDGEVFPSNFDRPHSFSAVMNYRFGSSLLFSSVLNISSGSPFTLPEGKFLYNGQELAYYNTRNNYRAPAIHRLDVSLQIDMVSKKKLLSGQLTLSIYNIYGRDNPFSVFFQDLPGSPPQAYKLTVIGSPFPSIGYEITF